MSLDVTSVGPVRPNPPAPDAAARRTPPGAAAPPAAPAVRVDVVDTIPASPPPEVLDAIGAASRALEHMHAQGRELRFAHDDDSGVLSIEVWDLDGNLLRTIPPSKLLDLISTGVIP